MTNMRKKRQYRRAINSVCTVAVGDPSGRLTKRDSNPNSNYETNADEIEHELANIRQNYLENFFPRKTESGAPDPFIILRNGDWLSGMHCLEFLRDIASHFRIPELLGKERKIVVTIWLKGMDNGQVGGQDQLGNIQCGLDLIHRKLGSYAFGLTVPLLTTPDGKKFGKSETGTRNATIWLSKDKLTPYAFYQRILNLPDQLISSRLLRQLTFFSSDEIRSLMKIHEDTPDTRPVQRALARELTLLVHGASALHASELATRIFFPRKKSTEQTSLGIISEELTQQECDCLRTYLAPTVKLVPVIHSQLPVDWSTESVSRWLGCLLRTATSADTESSYVTNCLRKGVTLNDVVLFKPNNDMRSVQHPSDNHLNVDLTVCQLLQEAVGRCEARLGLNILKLGELLKFLIY
ncbi:tyrosyl-tRNA synthetase [Clonorchis sinensis]|uniref:tyrosine--tRNA ligase n=1 Tax=Clonorchis sinensis TaxID=79923 RepID=G7Y2Y8_CLOSI|nr:tyrosyl-tRNA synthetase [Clonorchis sinensis]